MIGCLQLGLKPPVLIFPANESIGVHQQKRLLRWDRKAHKILCADNVTAPGGSRVSINTASDSQPHKQPDVPTFSLTFLKSYGTTALGHKVPSAREAGGPADVRLVRSQWTGEAGDEAITGELARRALA